jgi:hypothetical protein
MSKYQGGCACGAIRYQVQGEPLFSMHCQCRQCQRVTGTGHASQFGVRTSSLELEGALSFYEMQADSGNTVRSGFCPHCGSPVLKSSSGYPEMVFLHAATLDDPRLFKPQKVVWTSQAQPWDFVDPDLNRS